MFRSHLVQQIAPRNGRLRHPTVVGAASNDFAGARPALHHGDVRPAHHRPRVRRPQQGDPHGWAAKYVPVPSTPPAGCTAVGSSPVRQAAAGSIDSLDAAKSRFSGIVT